jgi:hypothetical protein
MFNNREEVSGMWLRRGGLCTLAATALIGVGGGCGDGRPAVDTTKAEATVSGKVTLNGKPAAGETIAFDPSNVERKDERARTATIDKDGSYRLTTLAGQNRVSFAGRLTSKNPDIANAAEMHDLKPGENTLDFPLPRVGGPGY